MSDDDRTRRIPAPGAPAPGAGDEQPTRVLPETTSGFDFISAAPTRRLEPLMEAGASEPIETPETPFSRKLFAEGILLTEAGGEDASGDSPVPWYRRWYTWAIVAIVIAILGIVAFLVAVSDDESADEEAPAETEQIEEQPEEAPEQPDQPPAPAPEPAPDPAPDPAPEPPESEGGDSGILPDIEFPWDDPDWQWPWDRDDWTWPWDQDESAS